MLAYCGPAVVLAFALWTTIGVLTAIDLSRLMIDVLLSAAGVATLFILAATLCLARGEWAPAHQNAPVALAPASGGGQGVEAYEKISRRMQSLACRQIEEFDRLERTVEDPALLKGLFKVDHLGTQMRREAEIIAVLGGGSSWRQWREPVPMFEVLRSAIAETEDYRQVKLMPQIKAELHGVAVADVILMIAALVENATRWGSRLETDVEVRAALSSRGLAIEIDDRGRGMDADERDRANEMLRDPDQLDTHEQMKDGRLGLLVVAILARRHRIDVELFSNIYGGTRAVVVIPADLLNSEAHNRGHRDATPIRRDRILLPGRTSAQPEPAVRSGEGSPLSAASGPGEGTGPMNSSPARGDTGEHHQVAAGGRPVLPRRVNRPGVPTERAGVNTRSDNEPVGAHSASPMPEPWALPGAAREDAPPEQRNRH